MSKNKSEAIKVKYLDGKRFQRSIIASAKRVNDNAEHLNNINVFPVPDGDTGTNMAATLNSITRGAEEFSGGAFDELSTSIANSAIDGARGNSGAILAQFFLGLAEATRGKERVSAAEFAAAADVAVEQAVTAISNPREGTIITVMKDWAVSIVKYTEKESDFVSVLRSSLVDAQKSLEDTPNKLEVLKKAKVVDAGAQGFVNLLEGMMDFIQTGKIVTRKIAMHIERKLHNVHSHEDSDDIRFRYCTECMLSGDKMDKEKIRQKIEGFGDSLIVVGTSSKIRVHIHTNEPQRVFEMLSQYGEIRKKKIDDMKSQSDLAADHEEQRHVISIVTDSTADIPEDLLEKYRISIVPVLVQDGQNSMMDRFEITPSQFIDLLASTKNKLTTSQPPVSYFQNAYDKVVPHSENVLSIHISEKLSGTINGARNAKKARKDGSKIHVIDTRSISGSLGHIVLEAGRMAYEGKSLSEILERIEWKKSRSRIFVAVPTLTYVMRSGRVSKLSGTIGNTLNLKPVIATTDDGRLESSKKFFGFNNQRKGMVQMSLEYAKNFRNPIFTILHIDNIPFSDFYTKSIMKVYPKAEIPVLEASPSLAIHVGPGGTAIAVSDS